MPSLFAIMSTPASGDKSSAAGGPTPSATVSSERDARVGRAGEGAAASKPRSCVTCRSRKVRCDKKSPCSNCRRAQIPCVLPSDDKPPRWARRLDRLAPAGAAATSTLNEAGSSQVMNRLQNLENLVKNLSAELQQARVLGGSSTLGSTSPPSHAWQAQPQQASSTGSAGSNSHAQRKPGRLIPGNSGQSQYVASGFWSQISDEVCITVSSLHTEMLTTAAARIAQD